MHTEAFRVKKGNFVKAMCNKPMVHIYRFYRTTYTEKREWNMLSNLRKSVLDNR